MSEKIAPNVRLLKLALVLAAIPFVAMSCAIPPLPYPAERLAVGPFSFLPPNEPDWAATATARSSS